MQTPEGIQKQLVKRFLGEIGAYQFWPVQTGYGAATVDCLACIAGRFIAIEVKKEGYRPSDFTKRQQLTMQQMHCAGATVIAGDGSEIVNALKNHIGYVET